jgi:hypothetical protein
VAITPVGSRNGAVAWSDFDAGEYLVSQDLAVGPGEWRWQPLWDLLADLPERAWDIGSMFFVADGMTTNEAEFEAAVRAFLASLVPDSPLPDGLHGGLDRVGVRGIRFRAVRVTPRSLDELPPVFR